MKKIYHLEHSYSKPIRGIDVDDCKHIGIFTSKEKAKKAILLLKEKQGFKEHPSEYSDYPFEGFNIDEYILNESSAWIGGFITINDIDDE